MRLASAFAAALVTCACATWYPANNPFEEVSCRDRGQCDRMWSRLQVAIVEASRFRLQVANDTVIETFGPGRTIDFAYRATRVLNADGSGLIRVKAVCDATIYGCIRNPAEATALVAARIRGVT